MRSLLPPSGRSLLIREPGAPVPVEFRSAEIAVPVRINGARIAVRVRACSARQQRVFQYLKSAIGQFLHALNMEHGAQPCPTSSVSNPTPSVPS